jgi:hypothetical protein
VSDLQYVELNDWAAGKFKKPPSLWTLRRMAREGWFDPPAVKIGKSYHVAPNARAVDPNRAPSLVDRLRAAA